MQWAIWMKKAIAVPISLSHPLPEIEYILQDTQAKVLLTTRQYVDFLQPLIAKFSIKLLIVDEETEDAAEYDEVFMPDIKLKDRAQIIYTSGTTGKPKGVVTTHAQITAQIKMLVKAWEWTAKDRILHCLPLHHIHGIINALACPLWVGAQVDFLPKFEAEVVWERFLTGDYTVFMGVPTMYHRLIQYWEQYSPERQAQLSTAVGRLRLMISGSAALPVAILEKWKQISGHTLLERYGMTEIGMALSNPLHAERKAGFVGLPLPSVEVRLVDENKQIITQSEVAGEIQVKSPTVFLEYWRNPAATAEVFTEGWFRTGDIAVFDTEGYYRILGRNSTDIIKTGGYKVSALEIENVLLEHPAIAECAVVGLADEDWGEKIATAIILKPNHKILTLEALRIWAKVRLAHYKIPTLLKTVTELPRNVMGKVIKSEVKKLF
jgi:malonyl-CoA/methylmalonyl-CoA synthetase